MISSSPPLQVGTPRTHRRFLNREDGTYGPIPSRAPFGMLNMPFNSTDIPGLYCVGDSTFPGQVCDCAVHSDSSLFLPSNPHEQGVNAVVFSGFACAHRALCDMGMEPTWPTVDKVYKAALKFIRENSTGDGIGGTAGQA